jgi:hypothetical protein
MKTITPAQLIKQLNQALKDFGSYAFYDKGAHEVMELQPVIKQLNSQKASEVVKFLKEVRGKDEAAPRLTLASTLIGNIDDGPWTEKEWEDICNVCPDAY